MQKIESLLPERYVNIVKLLPYASESLLNRVEQSLLEMKSISEKI